MPSENFALTSCARTIILRAMSFFGFSSLAKIAFDVTEVALHAEPDPEGLHGGADVRGRDLQHFQVLGHLGGLSRLGAAS